MLQMRGDSTDMDVLLGILPLTRAADFLGSIPEAVGDALMKGLGSLGILLVLRILCRRDAAAWIGLGAAWMLVSLPSWHPTVIQWVSMAAASACFVLAVRVGLVAAIAAMATGNLLAVCTPLTLDFSRWYAWRTGVVMALLLAIALWGFRAVMGRRRILSDAMLEG